MAIKCEPQFRWTTNEDKIIHQFYPKGGIDACYSRLRRYHRSANAIYRRALELGYRKTDKARRAAGIHEGEGK